MIPGLIEARRADYTGPIRVHGSFARSIFKKEMKNMSKLENERKRKA